MRWLHPRLCDTSARVLVRELTKGEGWMVFDTLLSCEAGHLLFFGNDDEFGDCSGDDLLIERCGMIRNQTIVPYQRQQQQYVYMLYVMQI